MRTWIVLTVVCVAISGYLGYINFFAGNRHLPDAASVSQPDSVTANVSEHPEAPAADISGDVSSPETRKSRGRKSYSPKSSASLYAEVRVLQTELRHLKQQVEELSESLQQVQLASKKQTRKFDDAMVLLQTLLPLLVPLITYGPLKRHSDKKR